ncbi:hypothetical protein [Bradyrhizobium sp. SSUT77]|uniref:hypothetical protein n=1 Tax=Bradyrhizobium sp. SSUT77 TaxID=3040603 RepID=UPI00244933BE|nr:hypothetical protein [Bradyrhizobium sp. SSUT77]MDH2348612.1 hypothetical protein [Bradyrhizobium sp. SSUT77]
MIFFDPDGFWEHDAELDRGSATRRGLNVLQLIQKVFRYGRKDTASTLGKVRFTTDFAEIDAVLRARANRTAQCGVCAESLASSSAIAPTALCYDIA